MSTSLPERPDLDQLRRQAKELRDAVRWADPVALRRFARYHPNNGQGPWSLAAAQLVIARELGFSSWPKLKAAVDAAAAGPDARDHAFVAASIEGRLKEAAALWQADRGIASRSLHAAVVLGDTDAVRARLAADPESALAVDDERGWPPLLYACYSGWHQIDPHREARSAEVVRLLLEAGASPNTNNGGFRNRYRSAMRGAVEVNNPDITRVRPMHRAGRRTARPPLPRAAAIPRGPDGRHLGARRRYLRRRRQSGLAPPGGHSSHHPRDGARGHQRTGRCGGSERLSRGRRRPPRRRRGPRRARLRRRTVRAALRNTRR